MNVYFTLSTLDRNAEKGNAKCLINLCENRFLKEPYGGKKKLWKERKKKKSSRCLKVLSEKEKKRTINSHR